ncbi:MAG TPA: ABC transporter permease [Chthoniobacter sp.]|jgi:peptide/nickel transport system permease protein
MPIWLQNTLVIASFALTAWLLRRGARNERWQRAWKIMKTDLPGMVAGVIIAAYLLVGGADLLKLSPTRSVLDFLMVDVVRLHDEPTKASYSAPFADGTFSITKPEPLKFPGRHILGTTQIGKDTFVQALKGSSTALLLGGLTSAIYLPLGILLGIGSGYFRRWVDDVVQYIYSTIMAIPTILFLIAFIMVFGKGVGTMAWALALTTWIGLCRLLRGETLRLTERQYVLAARALGQSHWKIISSHLLPNVMHLVLISFVLGFSDVVLTEAILSYLGVGTPIGTASWGQMIDGARGELSREPLVWWNLTASGVALFGLVLSLNIFADALRRGFDPKR